MTVSYMAFLLLTIAHSVSASPARLQRPRGQTGSNTDEVMVTMEFLAVPSMPLGGFGSSDLASVKWLCWPSVGISFSESQERSAFCFLSFKCAHSEISASVQAERGIGSWLSPPVACLGLAPVWAAWYVPASVTGHCYTINQLAV